MGFKAAVCGMVTVEMKVLMVCGTPCAKGLSKFKAAFTLGTRARCPSTVLGGH